MPIASEATASGLLKQLHRVAQGLQHAPQQRNADKTPGQNQLQLHRAVLIFNLHDTSPYAPAGLPTAPTALAARSASSSLMWKREWTALTMKLQMKPTTSNPAMMYMVAL